MDETKPSKLERAVDADGWEVYDDDLATFAERAEDAWELRQNVTVIDVRDLLRLVRVAREHKSAGEGYCPLSMDRDLWQRQAEAAQRERDWLRSKLSELLARIHCDGGQYEQEYGTEKAVADAVAVVGHTYSDLEEADSEVVRFKDEVLRLRNEVARLKTPGDKP